ncbi:hypothetical protein [Rhizosphaericola mali]|uniref:Lipoprotein n=1 Tax=Rhizosphaericola mali TaxID=2545455 RepID=A0A5P2FX98_9BACT|nr:hypothetical protein [Rhizosphaericola mali]QES87547.1 hypothetical protein E0W69_002315 [Rhizosphaericola mali]
MMKKNKLKILSLGAVLFSIVSCQTNFDEQLQADAKTLQKKCPVMMDDITRWDSVSVLPGNTFRYSYTIVTSEKKDIDSSNLVKSLEPSFINQVKTEPSLARYRENNVTMSYSYKDKNGQSIATINISPKMYKD